MLTVCKKRALKSDWNKHVHTNVCVLVNKSGIHHAALCQQPPQHQQQNTLSCLLFLPAFQKTQDYNENVTNPGCQFLARLLRAFQIDGVVEGQK